MKKICLICLTLSSLHLFAKPEAVIFDWGNVIGFSDRSVIVDFLCDSLKLPEEEFEEINLMKRKAMKQGQSDLSFWLELAQKRGVPLPSDWSTSYAVVLKKSIGANPKMYELIDELKQQGIQVGMLSNIDDRYIQLIRSFGFYDPFSPCLLSAEIGLEKPDRKAYELLLSALNLPAHSVLFVDDLQENVDAAKELGIDALLFTSEQELRLELEKRSVF